jgi:hypothetical protein
MLEYFRDGGWGMWAILVTGIVTAALAKTKKGPGVHRVLFAGAIVTIAEGMLGMATGMGAVQRYVTSQPASDELAKIVAQGLGELANNGTFSFLIAALLGLAGYVFLKKHEWTAK